MGCSRSASTNRCGALEVVDREQPLGDEAEARLHRAAGREGLVDEVQVALRVGRLPQLDARRERDRGGSREPG
jgi:hypothetical protein